MRRTGWAMTAALAATVMFGASRMTSATGAQASDRGPDGSCSDATLLGAYGVQLQGTRPVPGPPPVQVESVVGVVLRSYDGQGGFTQVDNVKGSVTGTVPDREGSGTYDINRDCTGVIHFSPGPGILLEERFVVVNNGGEIRTAVMVPAGVMITGVQQRMHGR